MNKDIPFPVVFDKDKVLPKLYKPEAMPTTIFIDGKGVIQYRHKGFQEKDKAMFTEEVEQLIQSL